MAPLRRWRGYRQGLYEAPLLAAVAADLAAGDCALDIGAAYGYFTLAMAARVGETGRVVAFEPAPETAAALTRTLRLNRVKHVEQVQAALTAGSGENRLLVPANPTMARLSPRGGVSVATLRLDDWMAGPSAPERLDLIKIDVEGAELEVLEGGCRSLEKHRPTVLCELHRGRGLEASPRRCAERLQELGYRLQAIPNDQPFEQRLAKLEARPLGDRVLTLHLRATAR